MLRLLPRFDDVLSRYLGLTGSYPTQIAVRTPIGIVRPTLYSPDDVVTLVEVFCRLDYEAPTGAKVIVDLGSNIGLSALYFLTRNHQTRAYLYEPVELNVVRARLNLDGFESRYVFQQVAVSSRSGIFDFWTEETGRYGSLTRRSGNLIKVRSVHIDEVLDNVIGIEGAIDVLKIDIEGDEVPTIRAASSKLLSKVRLVYLEANPGDLLWPKLFIQSQNGSVCRLQRDMT